MDAHSRPLRSALVYLLMVALVVLLYAVIRVYGDGLPAASGEVVAVASVSHGPSLAHLLLALATVTIAARGVGAAGAKWLGQPRGLMAFVVLNVGLDLGVITPTVFAMLVVMALVTTFATSPALDLVLGRGREAWFPAEPAEPVAQP